MGEWWRWFRVFLWLVAACYLTYLVLTIHPLARPWP